MAYQRVGRTGESHSERRGVIWSAERERKWGKKEADIGMDF